MNAPARRLFGIAADMPTPARDLTDQSSSAGLVGEPAATAATNGGRSFLPTFVFRNGTSLQLVGYRAKRYADLAASEFAPGRPFASEKE